MLQRWCRRTLHLVPVLLLLSLAGYIEVRASLDRRTDSSAYGRAIRAVADGRLLDAERLFIKAGDHLDATARLAVPRNQLAGYAAMYDAGIAALSSGDYQRAIALLGPVAATIPDYAEVASKLVDAKNGYASVLRASAGSAVLRQDWLTAEQLYAELYASHSDDAAVASELIALQRQTVFVYTIDHSLMLASPGGGAAHMIRDEISASWPAWSPNRSQFALVGPSPNQDSASRSLYVVNVGGTGLRL